MLKGSNNSELLKQGVNSEFIFFYQRWQELLDRRTIDVHQYKILNTYVAINELIENIDERLKKIQTSDYNIINCMDETRSLLSEDVIIKKYEKSIYVSTMQHLECNIAKDEDKNNLMFHLQYVVRKLKNSYLYNIITELHDAIEAKDIKLIEHCSYLLISQCIHNGWSTQGLIDLVRFFRGEKPGVEKWNQFISILTGNGAKHDILISIALRPGMSWSDENLPLKSLGINTYTNLEISELYKGKCEFKNELSSEKRYIIVSVVAKDVVSAAHQGIHNVAETMDIASFYNIIYPWDIRSISIITINTLNWYIRVLKGEDIFQTYDYIDSSNEIFNNTKKIFADACKKTLQDRLRGAFSYTNISRVSFFQEEKYLNMWVALESLSRTNMYNDIISNIKENVSSALCLRYMYQMIRNYYEDCVRCGIEFAFSTKVYDFSDKGSKEIVSAMIEILSDRVLSGELQAKCTISELLKYRYQEIYELITDKKKIYTRVKKHNLRIRWQIQRLYRIRNEIAHSAYHQETSLVIYIEHLYDYLACFITEIVMCKGLENLDQIEQVFSIIKDNYNLYIEEGKNKTSTLLEKFYKTGIMDFIN